MSSLTTGLQMMNVQPYVQYLVKGVVLVLAVLLDVAFKKGKANLLFSHDLPCLFIPRGRSRHSSFFPFSPSPQFLDCGKAVFIVVGAQGLRKASSSTNAPCARSLGSHVFS